MRMPANHGVHTCVNHQAGQLALTVIGQGVFPTPVHHRDDHIGATRPAGPSNIAQHLLVFAPSNARSVVVGLKAAWLKFIEAQHGDAHAFFLNDERLMGLREVVTPAIHAHPSLAQPLEHVGKGHGAVVARMVVGQTHCIKMAA